MIVPIDVSDFHQIVFFTGAGMSAESGVPTYRGKGGIWHKYNWEEYACQTGSYYSRTQLKMINLKKVFEWIA